MGGETSKTSKNQKLYIAAEKGNLDVVKKMIRNGADVNTVEGNKSTALHVAAFI